MKHLITAAKIIFWVVLMFLFLRYFTFSNNNSLSFHPNWFSGDKNSCGSECQTLVGYSNIGFPIQIAGASTRGLYKLAWAINITTVGVVGLIIGTILYKIHYKKS